MLPRLLTASTLMAGLVASVLVGSAAGLGGVDTENLLGWSTNVSIAVAIADDPFAAVVCNQDLDGTVDSVGNVWAAHTGDWRYQGCDEIRVNARQPMAHAALDLGELDEVRITTALTRISTQQNRSGAGLAFFSAGSEFMYVIYDGDQEELILGWVDSSGISVAETVPISGLVAAEISVELSGPDVTVLVDGIIVIQETLDPSVYGYFRYNTSFGLVADNDNWSRFGSFRVEDIS